MLYLIIPSREDTADNEGARSQVHRVSCAIFQKFKTREDAELAFRRAEIGNELRALSRHPGRRNRGLLRIRVRRLQ